MSDDIEPDYDAILARLDAAKDDPVAQTVAMVEFACGGNAALRRAVEAAAIPHWFDADILAAILDAEDRPIVEELHRLLLSLSFVEPFPERGEGASNVHEATRRALRKRIAETDRGRFIELSQRATLCFLEKMNGAKGELDGTDSHSETDVATARVSAAALHEFLFHLSVADPIQGHFLLQSLFQQMAAQGAAKPLLSLARQLDELIEDELVVQPARATIQYVRARSREPYGDLEFVEACAQDAIRGYKRSNEPVLEGIALQLLGDIRIQRGDLKGAEEAFVEALRIDENAASQSSDEIWLQRNISNDLDRIGGVQEARGSLDEAEERGGV